MKDKLGSLFLQAFRRIFRFYFFLEKALRNDLKILPSKTHVAQQTIFDASIALWVTSSVFFSMSVRYHSLKNLSQSEARVQSETRWL